MYSLGVNPSHLRLFGVSPFRSSTQNHGELGAKRREVLRCVPLG